MKSHISGEGQPCKQRWRVSVLRAMADEHTHTHTHTHTHPLVVGTQIPQGSQVHTHTHTRTHTLSHLGGCRHPYSPVLTNTHTHTHTHTDLSHPHHPSSQPPYPPCGCMLMPAWPLSSTQARVSFTPAGLPSFLASMVVSTGNSATSYTRLACLSPASCRALAQGYILMGLPESSQREEKQI